VSASIFLADAHRAHGEASDAALGAPGRERFVPTEQARGPWDPRALHGGAPAALITSAFERVEPGSGLRIARLGFELLRPIPFAPLSVTTRIVRAGRRVQELVGELSAPRADGAPGEEVICRASALRVQEVPGGLPVEEPLDASMPGPDAATEIRFALGDPDVTSFAASAMEMRWLSDPSMSGPGRVWMRMRHPLLPGEPPTALARLAATADFGNGVSAVLPFERFLFINADLTVHLQRQPRGEWIGLDARTLLHRGGTGLSESVLHDSHGAVGRAFQTLVVAAR
jgi:acyl-Coa thioesterase superfamily protein/acyl-CoA thioesterase superfamily protein